MKNNFLSYSLTAAILLVLIFSAIQPSAARADDSTPVAPSTPAAVDTSAAPTDTTVASTATTVAPTDTSVAPTDTTVAPTDTTVASTDTAVPTDTAVAPTDTTVASSDTTIAPTDTTVAPTDTSTALDVVSTGTPVVVLDATGTAVPLATQAAANIIQTGDPIWCPSGDLPGNANCTNAETTVAALITDLGAKSGAGTVYFTSAYSTNDASFDPTVSSSLSGLTDLTIQGGWNGSTSSPLISGVTSFSVPLAITNWNGNVYLYDITISGATGDGLTVQTKGDIAVHYVTSNHNSGRGAKLDNSGGSGTILVDSSTFGESGAGNTGNGLEADSTNDITLDSVIAGYNGGVGAVLDDCLNSGSGCTSGNKSTHIPGAPGEVVIFPSSFNNNNYDGLDVSSNGFINLIDVTADDNGQSGASGAGAVLDNSASTNPYAVELDYLTGNQFNDNYNDGLDIYSASNINISQVAADGNGGNGASLDNTFGTNALSIDVIGGGSSQFDENGADGLLINSHSEMTLSDVEARSNGSSGAILHNEGTSGNSVIINGTNAFSDNSASGLQVYSSGMDTLNNITADGNTGSNGLYLDNTFFLTGSDVKLNGTNEFNSNHGTNLAMWSSGNLTLNSLTASDSVTGDGAYLDTTNATSPTGSVTLTGTNVFDGNKQNGLFVYADGAIDVSNVTAGSSNLTGNGDYGAYLSNQSGTVTVDPSTFDYNHLDGLNISSNDDVSLMDVNANYNSGSGTIISNDGSTTVDPGYFEYNSENGLGVTSSGDISLTGVDASDNGGDGANVSTTSGTVLVDPSQFNDNGSDGLTALAYGDITLLDVTASGNLVGSGAYLDNSESGDIGSIQVTSSAFDFNVGNSVLNIGGRGLVAHSNSDITLTDVTASDNALGGAELDNTTGTGSIFLTGNDIFGDNGFSLDPSVGLYAVSNFDITANGVTAIGNGYGEGGGAFFATDFGDLSITNSAFNENCTNCYLGVGFAALVGGDTTIQDVTADSNGNDPSNGYTGSALAIGGLIFDGGNVSIADSDFSGNCALGVDCSGAGILVDPPTGSLVSFDHVTANGNGTDNNGGGAFISTGGDVNIHCSTFNNNSGVGLDAEIPGGNTITLTGVTLNGNTSGPTDIFSGTLVNHTGNCGSGGKNGSTGSLPIDIIPVTGGLDCTSYSASEIELPDLDYILLPCPATGNATLTGQTSSQLPGKLDAKYTFVSGFNATVTPTLDGSMIVSFKIPAGQENANFTILYWDGSKWEDVGGSKTTDGFFQSQTNLTGVFVLVAQ